MSILIKGMEMPKNCDECPLLTEDGDYDVCFIGKKRVMWEWKHDKGSEVIHPKPDFCPLIEIPPHGRLIDADKLHEATYHRAFETDDDTMWQSGCWVRYRAIEQVQDNQPTVIPADKDGETWQKV